MITLVKRKAGRGGCMASASGVNFFCYPKQSRGATTFNIFPAIRQIKLMIVLILEIIDIPPRMLAIMLQSPISCFQASLATQPLDCVGRDKYIITFFFQLSMLTLIFCMLSHFYLIYYKYAIVVWVILPVKISFAIDKY